MFDLLAIPVNEYVTLMKARSSTWTFRVDTHYHHTRSSIAFNGNRLKAKAEIAAGDPPVFRELWRDALDGGRWDDEHTSSRPKNCHADRRPGRVQHKATFGALS